MHKDLKDLIRTFRNQDGFTRNGHERLDPSTHVLTVLARISAPFLNAAAKLSSFVQRTRKRLLFSLHRFVILFFDEDFI